MSFTMDNRRSKWSLHGALFTAIAATAVWLTGAPAYASLDMCTPDECYTACVNSCTRYNCGGLRRVLACNEPTNGIAECDCNINGTILCVYPQCS
jgi:hypothetical protein